MGILPNLKMCVTCRRKQPLGEKKKDEQIAIRKQNFSNSRGEHWSTNKPKLTFHRE